MCFSDPFLFEIFHRLNEAAIANSHHQIDGVEVFFTIEAAGQVGFGVCSRVVVETQRAAEARPIKNRRVSNLD